MTTDTATATDTDTDTANETETVMTVRDFTMIFDSYVEFEESVISTLMDAASERTKKGKVDADLDFDLTNAGDSEVRIIERTLCSSGIGVRGCYRCVR